MKLFFTLLATLIITSTPCDDAVKSVTAHADGIFIEWSPANGWTGTIVLSDEYFQTYHSRSLDVLFNQMQRTTEIYYKNNGH